MPTGIGTGLLLSSIIGGGSSIVGGALANKAKQGSTSTTTPTYDPQSQALRDLVYKQISDRLTGPGADLSGYTTSGLQDINKAYDASATATNNNLAARGLSRSPVAAAVDANRNLARAADIGRFTSSIPLLQRQLQTEDLGLAQNVFNSGRGSTGTGAATTTEGGGAGGAFSNLSQMLGFLIGSGAFKKGSTTPGLPAVAGQSFLTPGSFSGVW